MLILARKQEEDLIIGQPGQEVIVRVVEIRGDKVRLGIEAPRDVPVHRREVWEEIEADRRLESADRKPAKRITTQTKEGCD